MANTFTQINLARKAEFSNNKYSIPKGIGICWVGHISAINIISLTGLDNNEPRSFFLLILFVKDKLNFINIYNNICGKFSMY
jgi:hypothetical protein